MKTFIKTHRGDTRIGLLFHVLCAGTQYRSSYLLIMSYEYTAGSGTENGKLIGPMAMVAIFARQELAVLMTGA